MTQEIRYHCPRCKTIVGLERSEYLADKAVTPYPLVGWNYTGADGPYEDDDIDGVRFVCGRDGTTSAPEADGCGEPFWLSFVRFEKGQPIEPRPASRYVTLGGQPSHTPTGPDASPDRPFSP